MGFRSLSLYGLGRDFGLTADPTLAMKAAVSTPASGRRSTSSRAWRRMGGSTAES
jgi:hypothetical protein